MNAIILIVALVGSAFASPFDVTSTISGAVNSAVGMAGDAANTAVNAANHIPGVNASAIQEQLQSAVNLTHITEQIENLSGLDFDNLTPEQFLERINSIPGVSIAKNGFKLASDSLKFGWEMARTHNNTEVFNVLNRNRDLLLQFIKIAGKSLWFTASSSLSMLG